MKLYKREQSYPVGGANVEFYKTFFSIKNQPVTL